MPHSGGGGSHSGGSHGSSHGSSSYGGSRGGAGYRHRESKTYFTGARTYLYYDRYDNPQYIYSDSDLPSIGKEMQKTSKYRYLSLLIYIPFIAVVIFMITEAVNIPKKLENAANYEIIIEDNANVLDHTENLISTMKLFKEKTGITPAVITVNNEKWKPYYVNMEQYAYDLYVNKFSDETHFLIVYSEPTNVDPNFNDWHYELMEGNDTDKILTEDVNYRFRSKLQRCLTAETQYTKTEAIQTAINETIPTIMNTSVDKPFLFTAILMGAFIIFHMYLMIFAGQKKIEKYMSLKEIPADHGKPKVATCDYCGCQYIIGAQSSCPHCGAACRME